EEIKGLDLQFRIKRKWQSLGDTKLIDFQIHKNLSFDLVLGQDWLWMHEAKISFGHSPKTCVHYAKIVIDGMSIPLIEEGSRPIGDSKIYKASSTKNNSLNSIESALDLALEEATDMFKKLPLRSKDDKQRKRRNRIFRNIPPVPPLSRRLNNDIFKKKSKKNKVMYSTNSDTSSNSDTLDSNLEGSHDNNPILFESGTQKKRVSGTTNKSSSKKARKQIKKEDSPTLKKTYKRIDY
ncbi:12870_t:CDS:2, partial [Dentiscutata heterogama]